MSYHLPIKSTDTPDQVAEKIAFRYGQYGAKYALHALKRNGFPRQKRMLQQLIVGFQPTIRKGKAAKAKAKAAQTTHPIAELQARPTKNFTRCAIAEDMINTYGDHPLRNKLRFVGFPATEWNFEQMLINPLLSLRPNIGDIIGLEANPQMQPAVAQAKTQLEQENPDVEFHLINNHESALFLENSQAQQVLDLTQGAHAFWFDYMGQWGKQKQATLKHLLSDGRFFKAAWDEGQPGLLYITILFGRENAANIQFWADQYRECTAAHPTNNTRAVWQGVDLRLYGITSYVANLCHTQNRSCEVTRSIYYTGSNKCRMLLLGFKIHAQPKLTPNLSEQLERLTQYCDMVSGLSYRAYLLHDAKLNQPVVRCRKGPNEPTLTRITKNKRGFATLHRFAPPSARATPHGDIHNAYHQQEIAIYFAKYGIVATLTRFNLTWEQLSFIKGTWRALVEDVCCGKAQQFNPTRKPSGTADKIGVAQRLYNLHQFLPHRKPTELAQQVLQELAGGANEQRHTPASIGLFAREIAAA